MRFMRFKWFYFLLSALVIIPGVFSLIRFGLRPSIDFTGGTILEYRFSKSVDVTEVKKIVEEVNFSVSSVQASGPNSYILRLSSIDKDQASIVKAALAEKLEDMPEEMRFETVGPVLGKELLQKTIISLILAASFILGYVAWQFKNAKFGICAILAMFHDTLVILGIFSLLGHFFGVEVDTLFVTAVLTILSFSVHDTVVVYDRIRESQKNLPEVPFDNLVDKAITETLNRSLNNSLTIIFMLVALLLLGGATVKWFVLALLVGTVTGTYSSTFTAAPLLVVWEKIEGKRKKSI